MDEVFGTRSPPECRRAGNSLGVCRAVRPRPGLLRYVPAVPLSPGRTFPVGARSVEASKTLPPGSSGRPSPLSTTTPSPRTKNPPCRAVRLLYHPHSGVQEGRGAEPDATLPTVFIQYKSLEITTVWTICDHLRLLRIDVIS